MNCLKHITIGRALAALTVLVVGVAAVALVATLVYFVWPVLLAIFVVVGGLFLLQLSWEALCDWRFDCQAAKRAAEADDDLGLG